MNKKIKNFFEFKNQRFLNSKKALSPLVATILLVVFALVIGTITMNWGRSYVEKIKEEPEQEISSFDSAVIIGVKDINTPPNEAPLKKLQIQYITGEITKEEYLAKEKTLIND